MTFSTLYSMKDCLEQAKVPILNRWMAYGDTVEALGRNKMTPEFFSHYFGIKVIEYALGVIKGVNKPGNCPVIGVMLSFFEKKNIPMEDLFLICVNFKNAFIRHMLEEGVLTPDALYEVSLLIDRNFAGVIRAYRDASCKACVNDIEQSGSHVEDFPVIAHHLPLPEGGEPCTSALQYLQEIEIDIEILDELDEIERETLSSLDLSGVIDYEGYREVIGLFSDYVKVLNQLFEFKELAYTLIMLIELLENSSIDEMGEEKRGMLTLYIKAIIEDLSLWRRAVFVDQSAEDIHYLDRTLLSSIAQLQILLSEEGDAETEEIEFF
jgi:hypothetical protein